MEVACETHARTHTHTISLGKLFKGPHNNKLNASNQFRVGKTVFFLFFFFDALPKFKKATHTNWNNERIATHTRTTSKECYTNIRVLNTAKRSMTSTLRTNICALLRFEFDHSRWRVNNSETTTRQHTHNNIHSRSTTSFDWLRYLPAAMKNIGFCALWMRQSVCVENGYDDHTVTHSATNIQ